MGRCGKQYRPVVRIKQNNDKVLGIGDNNYDNENGIFCDSASNLKGINWVWGMLSSFSYVKGARYLPRRYICNFLYSWTIILILVSSFKKGEHQHSFPITCSCRARCLRLKPGRWLPFSAPLLGSPQPLLNWFNQLIICAPKISLHEKKMRNGRLWGISLDT